MNISLMLMNALNVDLPPVPFGSQGRDGAELLVDALNSDVGVGLNLASSSSPGPAGRPRDIAAGNGVEGSALGTRVGVGLAPKVVVDDVTSCGDGGVLLADLGGALSNGLGWGRSSSISQDGCDNSRSELHDEYNTPGIQERNVVIMNERVDRMMREA